MWKSDMSCFGSPQAAPETAIWVQVVYWEVIPGRPYRASTWGRVRKRNKRYINGVVTSVASSGSSLLGTLADGSTQSRVGQLRWDESGLSSTSLLEGWSWGVNPLYFWPVRQNGWKTFRTSCQNVPGRSSDPWKCWQGASDDRSHYPRAASFNWPPLFSATEQHILTQPCIYK